MSTIVDAVETQSVLERQRTRPSEDRGLGTTTIGSYLATRLEQIGLKHNFAVAGDYNLVLLSTEMCRQIQQVIDPNTTLLVETGDSWFNRLKRT